MELMREKFIENIEKEIKTKVLDIEWVYGKGDWLSDDEPLYYCDCTLQVIFYNGNEKGFISFDGGSYCSDPNDLINTLLGDFEEQGSNIFGLTHNYNIDRIMDLMRDYFYNFADSVYKPFRDKVYYESM